MILTRYFIFIILIFLFPAATKKNLILFHCYHCKGCVSRALSDIVFYKYDSTYQIILDSTCFTAFSIIGQIKFKQLSQIEIDRKYGEFANIRIYDGIGNKVNLNTG